MEKRIDGVPEHLSPYIMDGTSPEVCLRYARVLERAKEEDYGEFDRDIVVLDTETTGLSFNHDELIQIAAARMERGVPTDWFVTFVNPGKEISDEIAHLTNISNEDVADAPTPQQALEQLVQFVGSSKVVAHNASFDKTFVTKHPEGYPLLENLWIDSLDLARVVFPRFKGHRLIDLARAFGAPESTHRADDDVAATCFVYHVLLAAIQEMPSELVSCIGSLASAEEWSTGSVFAFFAPAEEEKDGKKKRLSLKALRNARLSAAFSANAASAGQGAGQAADGQGSAQAAAANDQDGVTDAPETDGFAFSLNNTSVPVLDFPSTEELDTAFSKAGLVGLLYENYEPRYEQRQMAKAVARAFEESDNLVVEAGTGVGKSMAYLVPAALLAQRNGIPVGVATKTNALLDQLVYHELPALSEALGGLRYAALKGTAHYPCLWRIERLVREGAKTKEIAGQERSSAPALATLLSYVEQSVYDDIDTLKIDYRTLPRKNITVGSNECLRRKCPFFGPQCFVHGARKAAEQAQIVVTNHSLLLCDLVAEGGLLPQIDYWILDEAHGVEAEARQAFSETVDAEELLAIARKLDSAEASHNPLIRAERMVESQCSDETATLLYALVNKAREASRGYSDASLHFARHMKGLLFFDPNPKASGYEFVDLWVNNDVRNSETFRALGAAGRMWTDETENLITACQELAAYLDDFKGVEGTQRELAATALGLKEMLGSADIVLGAPQDKFAYSATLCKKKDRTAEKLEALMMQVGPALEQTLFARTKSVVLTSATLTVGNSFDTFTQSLGLNCGEEDHCWERGTHATTLHLDSSYNYNENMRIYVLKDMPEPGTSGYLDALQDMLIKAHIASNGSLLTLFTNRKEMEACFAAVNPELKEHDLRLVCQKWGVSVKGLRDEFLEDETLSLFALKSFWEGFDAPGTTLRGVIVPKLPFAKPTDPLSCERAERDNAAWSHYVLPAAIIETKQAVGRLIRSAEDRGIIVFADKRLVSKSYGRLFLRSMPSENIRICTTKEMLQELVSDSDDVW